MRVLILSAVLLSTACAASSENDSGSGGAHSTLPGAVAGTKLTVEEYCTRKRQATAAWCDYREKCCSAADLAAATIKPFCDETDTVADCVKDIDKLVRENGVEFHGEFAEDCLMKFYASVPTPPSSCSGLRLTAYADWRPPVRAQIASCRELLRGTKGDGQKCDYDNECLPAFACRETAKDEWKCKAKGAAFTACSLSTECADGLRCIGKVCRTVQSTGGTCTFLSDCETGLTCDTTCRPPIPVGGSCEGALSGCTYGAACSFTTMRCQALGADGMACSSTYECQGRCDETTKRCVSMCGGKRW